MIPSESEILVGAFAKSEEISTSPPLSSKTGIYQVRDESEDQRDTAEQQQLQSNVKRFSAPAILHDSARAIRNSWQNLSNMSLLGASPTPDAQNSALFLHSLRPSGTSEQLVQATKIDAGINRKHRSDGADFSLVVTHNEGEDMAEMGSGNAEVSGDNTSSSSNSGDIKTGNSQYIEISVDQAVSDQNLSFDTNLSNKQRAGFKELIKTKMGKLAFIAFLDNKKVGLSFWLHPENLEKFKNEHKADTIEQHIGAHKKIFGNTKKMLRHIAMGSLFGKAAGKQFRKGQDNVINLMCLDLYPQFLYSEYFEKLKTKSGGVDVYKSQLKCKELASTKLESPLQWLLRFAEIAELIHECVCICDPTLADCPIVYANQAFNTCTGYTRSEVLGKNCRFLQGPETLAEVKEQLRNKIEAGKDSKCTIINYRKNGEKFENLLSMKPVMIKGQTQPRFFISIQFDLSLRRTPLEFFQLETVLGLIPTELDVMFDKTL